MTDDLLTRLRGLIRKAHGISYVAGDITQAGQTVEQAIRELDCRDALINDHLATILRLQNRVEEEDARADAAERERDEARRALREVRSKAICAGAAFVRGSPDREMQVLEVLNIIDAALPFETAGSP